MCRLYREGDGTVSTGPVSSPVISSIGTRRIDILPPRLLPKYRCLPLGAQTGSQTEAASIAIVFGVPPVTGTVAISPCSPCRPYQNAMRRPFGDQLGIIASG